MSDESGMLNFVVDTCTLINFEDYPELNKQSGNCKNEF